MTQRTLKQNATWFVAGRVVDAACGWGRIALLARFGGPAMVGEYALAMAICLPVVVFSRLHLRTIQASDAKDRFAFGNYVALTSYSSALALLLVVVLSVLSSASSESALVIVVVGLLLICESFSEVIFGAVQQRERLDLVAISVICRSVLALLAGVAGFLIWETLLGFVGGAALAYLAVLATYDRWTAARTVLAQPDSQSRGWWASDLGVLLALTKLAAPLGVVTWLLALETSVPRYFIEFHLSPSALGVFTALASFIVPGRIVTMGLAQASMPRLAQYYAANDLGRFRSLVLKLTGISFLVGTAALGVMVFAGDWLISTLYTPQFAADLRPMFWIMVFGIMQQLGTISGTAVTAMRRFWLPLPVHVVCLGVTCICAALWVPWYGLSGAALTMIACGALYSVAFYWVAFTTTETSPQ